MRRVSIASASQIAADAAAKVADAGGNAVDAAIAGVIVSMCTDPGVIAPGAGGFLTIWPAGDDPIVIDAYAEMPGRGLPEDRFGEGAWKVNMGYGGGVDTVIGYGSVATPGIFAGLGLANERYGEVPWSVLLDPAISAVEEGFPLSGAAAEYLAYAHEAIFGWDTSSYATLHHPDGNPLGAGDMVHIPELAQSLHIIATEGPDSLYTGSLGGAIASATANNGGILTEADLAAYEAHVREPILVEVDDWTIATNPPPAVGGACMAAMLLLLGTRPISEWDQPAVQQLVRIQRSVLTYRSRVLDPAHGAAEQAAELLRLARLGDFGSLLSSPSTTHTSACDSDGNACAVTVSAGYGSGAMVPGTGLWLNNSLGELELHPAGFHGVAPGTRLVSNMAPSIARRADGSVLAIGTPGANRITTALSLALFNFIHLGMALHDAVAAPRVHTEIFDGAPTISAEPGMPAEPFEDMVVRKFPDLSMYFGGIQATLWDPGAGLFETADPRRQGGIARGGAA